MEHLTEIAIAYPSRSSMQTCSRAVRAKKSGWLLRFLLLLFLVSLAACGENPPAPKTVISPPASADAAILDMLNNIKTNGYDSNPSIDHGLGGLWINWRYGTQPLQTNLNDSGDPDSSSVNPPRHDILTDLRYIHALWLYKNRHPSDAQFDSEITRYTAIVKYALTAQSQNDRGWLYDLLIDVYHLSHDTFYLQAVRNLASYTFTTLYHANTGLIYKTDAGHPRGYYRVDLALEDACMLIQTGILFNQPAWRSAGQRLLQQLYATAYVPQYHEFLDQLNNVLLPNGTVNPAPSIFRGAYANYTIEGGQVRMGAVGQEILALLHVYIITHDHAFLDDAIDLLNPLTADDNALGLWDTKNQGYFAAAIFPGPDVKHAGTPKVSGTYKESGRQLQMLETFRVANSLTNNRYQSMQDAMLQVALDKAYYPPQHGVLYEETPDWKIVVLKNGKRLDWATTEAMGITLEGLFSLGEASPW